MARNEKHFNGNIFRPKLFQELEIEDYCITQLPNPLTSKTFVLFILGIIPGKFNIPCLEE